MMIKYRINEVAKDLNVSNKDVINVLAEKFGVTKKPMTALEEDELDVIFETFTKNNQVENFDAFFARRRAAETYTVSAEEAPADSIEEVVEAAEEAPADAE